MVSVFVGITQLLWMLMLCFVQPAVCDGHGGHKCAEYLSKRFVHDLYHASRSLLTSRTVSRDRGIRISDLGLALAETFQEVGGGDARNESVACTYGNGVCCLPAWLRVLPMCPMCAPVCNCCQTEKNWMTIARRSADSSGACLTAVILRGRTLAVANVGDCRAVLRQFNGTLKVLTNEHRYETQESMFSVSG